jgi:hypothetical protein
MIVYFMGCILKWFRLWESQHLINSSNSKFYSNLFKTIIKDIFTQEMRNGISDNKKLKVFKSLNTDNRLVVSRYLLNINCIKHRVCITKLRADAHNLGIETGRHPGLDQKDRTCLIC